MTLRATCIAAALAVSLAVAGCGKSNSTAGGPVGGLPASSAPAQTDDTITQVSGDAARREPAALPLDREPKPLAAGESDAARRAFDRLVKAHRDEDAEAWIAADDELAKLSRAAAPTLARGLRSGERSTRELAAMMLAKIGPEAEPAADALHAALGDESPLVRANAAAILSLLSKHTEEVRNVLAVLLDDSNPNVRMMAAYSVGNLGRGAEPLLPRLTQLLADDSPDLRQAAATALGNLGSLAKGTIPRLDRLADDESLAVRTAAVEAKRRIALGELPGELPGELTPNVGTGDDGPAVAETPPATISRPIGGGSTSTDEKPAGPKLTGPSLSPPDER